MNANRALLLMGVLSLAACSDQDVPRVLGRPAVAAPAPALVPAPHGLDPAKVARGAQLFQENCAACHGANAEGASSWHKKSADGKYPPPPLDEKGHAWHHPLAALKQTIREGTLKTGGGMPPWGEKLSDQDIEAVIAWFQSKWSQEAYKNWAFMDEKARRGLAKH